MSNDVFETTQEQDGPFIVKIEMIYDYESGNYFFNDYGKFSGKCNELGYVIDRKANVLYGPYVTERKEVASEKAGWEFIDSAHEATFQDLGIYDVDGKWYVDYKYRVILCDNVHSTWERNAYEYFIPSDNYDMSIPEERGYFLQDYMLMEDYNRQEWSFVGVKVSYILEGETLSENSLWGIMDSDKDGIAEAIKECKAEAKAQLSSRKNELAHILSILETTLA